jgi:excisionase family DNA binding protein
MMRMGEAQKTTGEGSRPKAQPLGSDLIEIHEVAEVLCVPSRRIQPLVAERRIPYVKIGRFVWFDRAELSVWLDQQRVASIRASCFARSVRR